MTEPIVPEGTLADVAQELNSPERDQDLPYAQLRQGVVQAINPSDNTASIYLSGDTSVLITGVHFFNSFQPQVNDTIFLLKNSTDLIGVGKVGTGTFTAYGQAQNVVTANNVITVSGGFFTLSSSPNGVTFTKRYSTSNLFVNLSVTGWADVISGGMTVAVNISGVDYICGSITLDRRSDSGGDTITTTQRVPAVGSTVIPNIPAGSVTALIRIRNNASGSNLHVDLGDYYSLTVQEVL